MTLEVLIEEAKRRGASDLHVEPGLPLALRVRGKLISGGEPLPRAGVETIARELLVGDEWAAFLARRSADLSRTVRGVRCRINVLMSLRGVGLAVRLLPATRPTLERLNLHPELRRFADAHHGMVIVSGPTGCGKSSTLAALVEEVNQSEARHVLTLEEPIEHVFRPRKALIRQREVGRDTPSFEQGLIDALREDPDVIVVGELRDPTTMRLALNAAETGHLVLTTLHSSSTGEALQRLVMAFPAEIQGSVAAQLGDCLVGAICQRLRYRADLDLRVPECEILWASSGVRGLVRQGAFSKIPSAIEGGGADGMFTFARYATWAEKKQQWLRPLEEAPPFDAEPTHEEPAASPLPPQPKKAAPLAHGRSRLAGTAAAAALPTPPIAQDDAGGAAAIEIPASDESLADLVRQLEKRSDKR